MCEDQPPSVIATLADGSLPDCTAVAAAGICTSEGGARALAEENCPLTCGFCVPSLDTTMCEDQPPSVIATLADGSLPDCTAVAAAGICTSEGGARALAEENCCASCSPTVCEAGTAGVNTTTQSQVRVPSSN
jgi:hypothetical protein